ncbi:MAG TPA: glycosyltransferase family 4 protein, partial [Pirellulales bacterium]
DPKRVAWSGIVVTGRDECDEEMCLQAARFARLYGGPANDGRAVDQPERGRIRRFGDTREALAKLCADSDILIVWGVADLGQYLDRLRFAGQVVLVSHGAGNWTETILRESQRAADWLVGVSRPAAAAFGAPRAVVIHNGGDQDRCQVSRSREAVRSDWGAHEGERLIGYVGRYSWEKNPLAAALAANALGAPYRAVYVGSGWKEREVRAAVGRLTTDALFAPPQNQIGNVLNALDVMVLASPSEGFSLVLTEAWLCGLPTVATRVGAVPELEAIHGRLVTPAPVRATAEELAAAVKTAIAPENGSVVERAKSVAWRHYTARAMADRWTEFLSQIASPARAGSARTESA